MITRQLLKQAGLEADEANGNAVSLPHCFGSASSLSLCTSSAPYAVALGYLVWSDVPNAMAWFGIALMVGSGLYLLHGPSR